MFSLSIAASMGISGDDPIPPIHRDDGRSPLLVDQRVFRPTSPPRQSLVTHHYLALLSLRPVTVIETVQLIATRHIGAQAVHICAWAR